MTSTYLVHGPSGTQGSPVARRLVHDGHRVLGLSRSPDGLPEGVEHVAADLSDADSLARAYDGVDGVAVHLPLVFDAERAMAQAHAVVEAAKQAGVRRVVFNTGGPILPVPVGVPYLDARTAVTSGLDAAGISTTTIGPAAAYMENLSAPFSAPSVREGTLAYPLPQGAPVPWLAMSDLADVTAELLAAGPDAPAVSVLAGPQMLTGDAAAAALSSAVGHQVTWRTVDSDTYADMLVPHLGEEAGRGIAGFYAPPPPGAPPMPGPDPALVRQCPTTLEQWAAQQDWSAG